MKILIAYDGSDCADAAVVGMRKAGIPKTAEILVLSVIDASGRRSPGDDFPTAASHQPPKTEVNEGEAIADTARKWIQSNFPESKVTRKLILESPATAILEKARSWNPDLLIAGSHGRSFAGRVLFGGISLKLAHEAPCSVLLVRAQPRPDPGLLRILVGSDGSIGAGAIVQEVAGRSWPEKTQVRIVSVVETIVPVVSALETDVYTAVPALSAMLESDKLQRTRLEETAKESIATLNCAGLNAAATIVDGDPKRAIVEEADRWNADTIFVGARGLGRLEQILLGSVSNSVLKHAHCSVEVVRRGN